MLSPVVSKDEPLHRDLKCQILFARLLEAVTLY
jgi:hypothetical protein